jgi:predicted O-linked N-acetylglucosamine transferase (SPINDLY family)
VQVTYLGYCGTTGLSEMDYRISDPYLDPPETDLSIYSERTIHLEQSYWCYRPMQDAPEVSQAPACNSGTVTFGSLNTVAKITNPALDLWASILRQMPGSRLLLHANADSHRRRVINRFVSAGVDGDRIEFVGTQPYLDYLQTYHRIDVSLDPFPHGGGITSCDSLWMGVPFITLRGTQSAVGRGGCSILQNIGLSEFIADDSDQYASIAQQLGGDLTRLTELRTTLRQRMEKSPLMNALRFARDIESAYRKMWLGKW